jgi:hypothetical protein
MISENAARGRFPVHTKLDTAAKKFNLDDLSEKVRKLDEWEVREAMDQEQNERDLHALMVKYGV